MGHAYEFDLSSDAWIKIEELFRLIGNRDDIFYGTNAEVLLQTAKSDGIRRRFFV